MAMTAERTSVSTVIAERTDKVDLLNRQEFIEQLIKITESLSVNNENSCYAINGEWGVGKTYVLESFERQIQELGKEGTTLSKYLVFHYNCWQYDYYEEPLIAVVAAILDQIDEKTALIPADKKQILVDTLKTLGVSVWKKGCTVIEKKFGVDLDKFSEFINTSKEDIKNNIEENHNYDSYLDFKKTIKELSQTIEELSREQTVVVVVDELDRCLPEYAIKVLERLHHIFDEIPNVQVVLAVDKRQLENAVKSIFGEEISVRRYLAKFIDFEVKLITGELTDKIGEVYRDYFDCFTGDKNFRTAMEVCTTLLNGIDIRTCKAIVKNSYLCHRLLNPTVEPCNAAILCVEIFLTILKEYDLNIAYAKKNFDINNLFTFRTSSQERIFFATSQILTGLAILSEKYKDGEYIHQKTYSGRERTYIDVDNLWGILLGSYRKVLGFAGDKWINNRLAHTRVAGMTFEAYILKYWKFIKILN